MNLTGEFKAMGQMARLMGRDAGHGLAGHYIGNFGSSVLAGKMSGRASNYFLGAGVSTAQKAFRMGVPGALAGYAGYKAVRDPDSTTGKIARFGLAAAVVGGAVYAGSKRGNFSALGNMFNKTGAASTMAREATVSSGSVANSVVRSGHAAKIYDMPLASRETRASARLVKEQANYRLKYGSLGAHNNIAPPPNFGAAGRNRSMLASYPGYANPMSGGASSFGGHHIPSSFTRQTGARGGRLPTVRGLRSTRYRNIFG